MSAVKAAAPSRAAHDTAEFEREILTRIARGGLLICDDELRYQLRREGEALGRLPWLLADLEQRGLIESAVHYRLTEPGRQCVPEQDRPGPRAISPTRWTRSAAPRAARRSPPRGLAGRAKGFE
ncbi:MAG: hypothetical protein ACLP50_07605 [Solirubrobacteraceae bacterium]